MKLHLPHILYTSLLAALTAVTLPAETLTWAGGDAGNWGDAVWNSPSQTGLVFTAGDTAVFDGTGAQITVGAPIAVGGITATNETGVYTILGTGALSGDGITLAKSGAGELLIGQTNAFANITVNLTGGILRLGAQNALGTGGAINITGAQLILGAAGAAGNTAEAAAAITLAQGGILSVSAGGDVYNDIVVGEEGGVYDVASGQTSTFRGTITGTGDLEKTGSGTLRLVDGSSLAGYGGTLTVSAGSLNLGNSNKLDFSGAAIVMKAGTRLDLYGGGQHHSIANDIALANGSMIYVWDASAVSADSYQYNLSGTIRIGESASDVIDLKSKWAKQIALTGSLVGAGTLQFLSDGQDGNEVGNRKLIITGANANFTGAVNVGSANGSGDVAAKSRAVVLGNENALVNATVNLVNTNSHLWVDNESGTAAIAGLTGKGIVAGTQNSANTGMSESAQPRTLILNQKEALNMFSGTLNASIALVKRGAGLFAFSGVNNGRITLEEGVLQLGAGPDDFDAGALTVTGGSLELGGLGVTTHVTVSSLQMGRGVGMTVDIIGAEHDQLTYTGADNVAFEGLAISADLSQATEESYTLINATGSGSFTLTDPSFLGLNRGAAATLSLGADGKSIILTITENGTTGSLNWTGEGDRIWTTGGAADNSPWNLVTGEGDSIFYTGDSVTFGADAADKNVIIAGDVLPGDMTVTAGGYVFDGDGSILGAGKLTMNADGTLTINNTNLFTGGTDLVKGTIVLGNSQALGNGKISMGDGTSLVMNGALTVANEIGLSGAGSISVEAAGDTASLTGLIADTAEGTPGKLVKEGGGKLVLNGSVANTYTGGTQVKGGTLSIARADMLGTGEVIIDENAVLSETIQSDKKLLDNAVTGAGTLLFVNNQGDETDINKANFAGFAGQIELTGNQRYGGGNGSNLTQVTRITVNAGTQLAMGGGTWAQDFRIAGQGTGTGAGRGAALRMDGGTVIQGDVELMGDANVMSYNGQMATLAGDVAGGEYVLTYISSGFEGTGLTLSGGSVVLKGLAMSNSSLTLGGGNESPTTLVELGAGGINATGGTLIFNNLRLKATEQWAQNVGTGARMAAGTANTVDTNGFDITFAGDITQADGDAASLVKEGDGTLTIGAGSNYQGTTTVNGGILDISGAALGGDIALSYGSLANAGNATGRVTIAQSDPTKAPSTVSLGGMSGNRLSSYRGAASRTDDVATKVTDIGNGTVSLNGATLGVSSDMVGNGASGSIFSFSDPANGTLSLSGALALDLTDAAAAKLLEDMENALIRVTDGTLDLADGTTVLFNTPYNIFKSLFDSGVTQSGNSIQLQPKGGEDAGWLVQNASDEPLTIGDGNKFILDAVKGIHNNGEITLDISGDGSVDLKNLEGAADTAVIRTGDNTELTVNLVNAGDVKTSVYQGSIEGDAALSKQGADYDMTIGGNVRTSRLSVEEGILRIGGTLTTARASIDAGALLELNGTGSRIDMFDAQGGLTLGENASATVGSLTTGSESSITLGVGSLLTVESSVTLNGGLTGNGIFAVSGAGNVFALGTGASFGNGATLALRNGASTTVDAGGLSIGGLAGDGTVTLNGGTLELHDATAEFSGNFAGTGGTLRMNGTGKQTLTGAGSENVRLDIGGGGEVILQGEATSYGQTHVRANSSLTLKGGKLPHLDVGGDFTMEDSARLNVYMDVTSPAEMGAVVSSTGTLNLGNAEINLYNASTSFNADERVLDLVLFEGGDGTDASLGSDYVLSAGFLSALYNLRLETRGSDIVLVGMERTDNPYLAGATTFNSTAGAMLLDASKWVIAGDQHSTLYQLSDAVARDLEKGETAAASRKMAAAAGSTVNALGTAQRDALRAQMTWIRNRTSQMGVDTALVNQDMPYFHMWMEATGFYSKLDADRDESGYDLTTWGGTVGFDADVSEHATVGAAFTASYGDLTASAADTAEGDLNSYYANVFGRVQIKRWTHTLVLTGMWNDASLDRTVDYGSGSYTTKGDTSGWGFGAMYELAWDACRNEERTSLLQPFFNASVVTTRMDAYSETGAGNAGLEVGEQKWTTGTLALGARWVGQGGEDVFGRRLTTEFRANVAQDVGDERGETAVGFQANPGFVQRVRGAATGKTAFQIGAGMCVPVGLQSSLFVNADADFRSGSSSVSGSVGYRYDF